MKALVIMGIWNLNTYSDSEVKFKPLSVGALQDWGILSSGHFGENATPFENEWVDHFGAFIKQSGNVNEKLSFQIGLGGIYQFQKPENVKPEWGGTQYKDFFMGPTDAYFLWNSNGDKESKMQIQFGIFNYKYSSSTNLGEYLFRTGPYPTYLLTGGYSQINNSAAGLQALRITYSPVQNLKFDFLINTETSIPPLYDFSLSALARYSTSTGFLNLTAGAQLKRIIPMHDFRTTLKSKNNSYFSDAGVQYTGKVDYYLDQKNFWSRKKNEALKSADPILANTYDLQVQSLDATISHLKAILSDTASVKPNLEYYTTAGTILTSTVSIEPQKLLELEMLGENDLKIYAEVALLGWKNYPIFYEKRRDRMPILIGFNFPTFKVVDLISFEFEYFNSPWINSYSELGLSNGATPDLPTGRVAWSSLDSYNDIAKKDNTSWSFLVQKKVGHAITVSAQAARDHLRMPSFQNLFGPGLAPNEALSTSKNWYGMLQCSFGF